MARPHTPYLTELDPMLPHLRRSGKTLLSRDAWKIRILLWSGAILVGLVASGFAISSEHANDWFHLMEMTDNHSLVLPLMAIAFIAYMTSRLVCPEPIYRVLAMNFLPVVADAAPTETRPASPGKNQS